MNSKFVTLAAAPLVLTPFVRNQGTGATQKQPTPEIRFNKFIEFKLR